MDNLITIINNLKLFMYSSKSVCIYIKTGKTFNISDGYSEHSVKHFTLLDIDRNYLTAKEPEQRVAHIPPMVAPGPVRP